jgi:hypothetical protein
MTTPLFVLAAAVLATDSFSDWRYRQELTVPRAGLVKISLPPETLGAARPGLEDLRLLDDQGREVPFLIQRVTRAEPRARNPSSFQSALVSNATIITLETGLTQPVHGVTLDTPAASFIKAVRVEGATDQTQWKTLAQGLPIFRQPGLPGHLFVAAPPGPWSWLRLTVDDRRSEPIPFTGAQVHAAAEAAPAEPLPVAIGERSESAGQTRLTLSLPAANLRLANVVIEASDPLFTRTVVVATRRVEADAIKEVSLARGAIYRVAVEGQASSAQSEVSVEALLSTRECLLLIHNQDSPPLQITGVRATRRPVYLVFLASRAGAYQVLSGNRQCPAPRYDLTALADRLKDLVVSSLALTPPADNPAYRTPEALPTVEPMGTLLEVSAWKYRKPLKLARAGVQQLDLDLDVLGHAQAGLADLRLLRDDRQLPFVREHTSLTASLAPEVALLPDPKRPALSRWSITLPLGRLPVNRLLCSSTSPLFQRDVALYEEVTDSRGTPYRRQLGQARWVQRPDQTARRLDLDLTSAPETPVLFLETDNEDNPAIKLERFELLYPIERICFKAPTLEPVYLYYGNSGALAPQYDLSLVADQLLAAEKAPAKLGPEQQLKRSSWSEKLGGGGTGVIFWVALGLVVVGLLAMIARLLPKSPPSSPDEAGR